MAEIIRRGKVGEFLRITVPGVDTRFMLPQGTMLQVVQHYGDFGKEILCDVRIESTPDITAHPLQIRVPKGAEVEIVEE